MRRNKRVITALIAAFAVIVLVVVLALSGNKISKFFGNTIEPSTKNPVENTTAPATTNATTQDVTKEVKDNTPSPAKPAPKHISPVKVKAVYYSGSFAGSDKRLDHIIEVINTTELNAIVIDIKEDGMVKYKSELPEVVENKLYEKYYDVDKVIKKLHDNNIYVIGRIVAFRDDGLASKRVDLAIKKPDGSLWLENKKNAKTKWTN